MAVLHILSTAEQVAARLRDDLASGVWTGLMPGVLRLEKELGVNRKAVEAGLRILEQEGLLLPQGTGRRRCIVLPEDGIAAPVLRVAILPYESVSQTAHYMIHLQRLLEQAGHKVDFASRSLLDLEMDRERVARLAEQTEADAWVVVVGSVDVLRWFASQPVPAFALFGGYREVPMAGAGPDKRPALNLAMQRLVAFGHRRIVLLLREEHRKPEPSLFARTFLEDLASHGIPTGPYNLPDWEDHPKSFHRRLDALFAHTPPTALIIDEAPFFIAAQQYLARRGLVAPRDVSLVCLDHDPAFTWCDPPISHIRWDIEPIVRRISRWVDKVRRGRDNRRRTMYPAEFIEGGTIGPVKG